MSRILALVERELSSAFRGPVAYAVLGLFLAVHGMTFATLMEDYGARSFEAITSGQLQPELNLVDLVLRALINADAFVLMLLLPAMTMRLFSDEWRQGTSDLLLSYPFREVELVLGKFLAAASILAAMIVLALLYPLGAMLVGHLQLAVLLSSFLGLWLYGIALLAVGTFFSTLTENQLIAFGSTWATVFAFMLVGFWSTKVPSPFDDMLSYLSPMDHVSPFGVGLITLSDICFFLGIAILFLYLATGVLESRRWAREAQN